MRAIILLLLVGVSINGLVIGKSPIHRHKKPTWGYFGGYYPKACVKCVPRKD